MTRYTSLVPAALLLLFSCNSSGTVQTADEIPGKIPKPGTIMAQTTMPVTEDSLNHFQFTVKVIADTAVARGVYNVDAELGPNLVTGQFTLPRGAENALPVIRTSTAPYTCIIGFTIAGDSTFYDYFEVSTDRKATKMRYIKSYSF